ncbi:hypothetical protein BJ508DRAFT_365236 [Ascobolus immersus RN42]|uniref:Uncharacterized protein n=1 Tax=Ascobolus immersus RN42 TaxID=1160509 RepID=A0A3N4HQB6_ASCIM|nr:hypothetical protein BJ508DRAFT_365236 [Ascobolus immersus RN42]
MEEGSSVAQFKVVWHSIDSRILECGVHHHELSNNIDCIMEAEAKDSTTGSPSIPNSTGNKTARSNITIEPDAEYPNPVANWHRHFRTTVDAELFCVYQSIKFKHIEGLSLYNEGAWSTPHLNPFYYLYGEGFDKLPLPDVLLKANEELIRFDVFELQTLADPKYACHNRFQTLTDGSMKTPENMHPADLSRYLIHVLASYRRLFRPT